MNIYVAEGNDVQVERIQKLIDQVMKKEQLELVEKKDTRDFELEDME